MLNKYFKTIHNKYSRFFKFIFFLRYLFAIFFVSISLFLAIPMFFDFNKKEDLIKKHFLDDYNFKISEYEKIKYKPFPAPRLELKKVQAKFIKSNTNFNSNTIVVYPKIFSIYNFDYFEAKKIIFNENISNSEISNLQIFVEELLNQKKKVSFNNLDLKIVNNNKLVLSLEDIFFSNFGYKKNSMTGILFEKKLILKIQITLLY